jgi:hypothetical protein
MRERTTQLPALVGLASLILLSSAGCEERQPIDGSGGSDAAALGGAEGVDASGTGGAGGGSGGSAPAGSGGSHAGGGGGSQAGGSGGFAVGGSGGVSCDKDLSGTWDLIASRPGRRPGGGAMRISANGFLFQLENYDLRYTVGEKEAVWGTLNSSTHFDVTHTPAAFDTGTQPLPLGGQWSFSSGSQECMLSVTTGLITARCRAPAPYEIGGSDWPGGLPRPRNGQSYRVTRGPSLASQFGEAGGHWLATVDGDPGAACAVTVEGNRLIATCTSETAFNGTTELTIGADCVVSGLSSHGYELSGRRR